MALNWFYIIKERREIHLFETVEDAIEHKKHSNTKAATHILHTENYHKATAFLPDALIIQH